MIQNMDFFPYCLDFSIPVGNAPSSFDYLQMPLGLNQKDTSKVPDIIAISSTVFSWRISHIMYRDCSFYQNEIYL